MRPSPALVVAMLALFVALGGTSYAITQLPRNSVGTPQLRDGAVTRGKLSRATRRALHGERGPAGAKGATGPQGPVGAPGAQGPQGGPGATVVARARMTGGPVTVPPRGSVPVTLSGSWTQAADEVDLFVYSGHFSARPATCTPNAFGYALLRLSLGSQPLGSIGVGSTSNIPDAQALEQGFTAVAAPGASTVRSIDATLENQCTGAGESFTLETAAVDVVAFR